MLSQPNITVGLEFILFQTMLICTQRSRNIIILPKIIMELINYYFEMILNIENDVTTFKICNGTIRNDEFPLQIYNNLNLLQNECEWFVGGSYALGNATNFYIKPSYPITTILPNDLMWASNDVDIMIKTNIDPDALMQYLGLYIYVKTWTRGIDPLTDREETFDDQIFKVITVRHPQFQKNIQFVFFYNHHHMNFRDLLYNILDYPAHCLYKTNNVNGIMLYEFYIPVNQWKNILIKRIPIHLCKHRPRQIAYGRRGFTFY
jgi:hypothetical protein